MFEPTIDFIRSVFDTDQFIPLHEPKFIGREKEYLNDCIDSTFVSYVGKYVTQFEEMIRDISGAEHAVATVNGTVALHMAMIVAGVERGDEVITQPLTFVATCNAISYAGASPVFVDVDRQTLGMSPDSLEAFLEKHVVRKDDGFCYDQSSGKRIGGCMPMHTFGHPVVIDQIAEICSRYGITLIEDSAESLGSKYKEKATGTFGKVGVYSFNGNKTVTCGGGGVIITDDEAWAQRAKHITTTAKVPHPWEYVHDEIGYNYRLPNINAAVACAQLEHLDAYIDNKRDLAGLYTEFFKGQGISFVEEPAHCYANYWLNAVILENREQRDQFLRQTNDAGVMTRPAWTLMNKLDMFKTTTPHDLSQAEWLEDRLVNIPSSVRL